MDTNLRCSLLPAAAISLTLAASALPGQNPLPPVATAPARADPSEAHVPLASAPGWRAHLVFDAGVGVWTVAAHQLLPQFGTTELIALDDRGRCTVLTEYSGKWTPVPTIEDRDWLAPVAVGPVTGSPPGSSEIYTGGKGGRLWQIVTRRSLRFDSRIVGEWAGEEIHAVCLANLDPKTPRSELLVFLRSGRVWLGRGSTSIQWTELERLPGRVRQAVAIAPTPGAAPEHARVVAAVSRTGELALLRLQDGKLKRRVIAQESMGLGRIAVARTANGSDVLYVTRDDGVILRFAGRADAGAPFAREVVMVGALGPRGLVTGRFHEDPQRECLAVFGYSKKLVVLTRPPNGTWEAEVAFVDTQQGHWLTVAELDGRNATQEIVGSGFGGRVFAIARPPGYGLGKVLRSPALPEPPKKGPVDPPPTKSEPSADVLMYDRDEVRRCLLDRDGSCRDINFDAPTWDGIERTFRSLSREFAAGSDLRTGERLPQPALAPALLSLVQRSGRVELLRGTGPLDHLLVFVGAEDDGSPFLELTFFPEALNASPSLTEDFVRWVDRLRIALESPRLYVRYENASWDLGESQDPDVFLVLPDDEPGPE